MNASRRSSLGATHTAPWLALALGTLAAASGALAAARDGPRTSELWFGIGVLVGAALVARGLSRGARWAWWLAFAGTLVGLFFVLPITGAVLFGGSLEPVGTGWDLVLFPLGAALLVALLLALWARPKAARPPGDSMSEDS